MNIYAYSYRGRPFSKYKRRCQEYGRTTWVDCIRCLGPLSHLLFAGAFFVHTDQAVWAAIISVGTTKSTTAHRKVITRLEISPDYLFSIDYSAEAIIMSVFCFRCRYYYLDDSVAREILGKKLSSRYRKDLDEVADRTGIRLKSCRRQFDNVKRIFKCVEELPGNVTNNIKQNFLLPDELARLVFAIIAMIHHIQYVKLISFWTVQFSENIRWLFSLLVCGLRLQNDVCNTWILAISLNVHSK